MSGFFASVVKRPIAVLMLTGVLLVLGAVSLDRLPVDLLPKFAFPSVTVFAPYPGAGAEEIERLVVEPLEAAVASVPGLTEMETRAKEGSGVMFLRFAYDADLVTALDDVRVAVERARARLPDDTEAPQVFRFDPNQFPIMFLQVASAEPIAETTRLVRDELRPRLSRLDGVAAVDLSGLVEREARVELDVARMLDAQVSADDVARALSENNIERAAGKVERAGIELGLRTYAGKTSLDALAAIPIRATDAGTIRVSDVANVVLTAQEPSNINESFGQPAIRVSIRKADQANTVAVADAVRRELVRIEKDYPELDVRISLDQSAFIGRAIFGAKAAAGIGALFALAILLLFLRSFRATFIVGVSIPVSVFVAFFAMERFGLTMNLMTLGGLALGIGMLVDNAVVVLESIFVRRHSMADAEEAAALGAKDVALAVAASTASTLVIFLPVLFFDGVQKVVYSRLALVVVVALIASLGVSLTVVPAFAGRLFKKRVPQQSGRLLARVEAAYRRVLGRALLQPKATIVLFVGVLLASLSVWPHVKSEWMPAQDTGEVNVRLEYPVGTPLEVTRAAAHDVAERVESLVPEAERISMTAGPRGWWSSSTSELASVSVELPDLKARPRSTNAVVKMLTAELSKGDAQSIRVSPSRGFFLLRIIQGGGDSNDSLSLEIRGEDFDDMYAYADALKPRLEAIAGLSGVTIPPRKGRDELVVRPHAERAARYGLSSAAVADAVETYIRGRRVSTLRSVTEEIPIIVQLSEADRKTADRLKDVLLSAPKTGRYVALLEVAQIDVQEGPRVINRSEGSRRLVLGADLAERPLGEVAADVRAVLQEVKGAVGTRAFLLGEADEASKQGAGFWVGGLFALLLVFMVMAAQFESVVLPLVVLGAVPFAGVGVLFLLGLSDTTLNLYSFLGVIVLVGLCVNNAIVLVDAARSMRDGDIDGQRHSVVVAMRWAAQRRLRPILMTTATTLLGLLPVAISTREGTELSAPMAQVVVCGLFTSTAATLFVVPALFVLVAGRKGR